MNLTNKRILLGVTGGIAAYKAAELTRRLQDQGADVRVVMTDAATQFITPLTMQALSGHPVHTDLLDTQTESVMGHIELARWADLVLVAPASANFIARLVSGQADDMLTTLCLAAQCPIAVAPAMNQAMWNNPSTQSNLDSLRSGQTHILGPDAGIQACGEVGEGRLLDVDKIVDAVVGLFPSTILSGKHVLITAGPTQEAIDPVRYLTNRSSGKQGYALAQAAIEAGAKVTLVSGPTNLPAVERADMVAVTSAQQMYDAVMEHVGTADVFIGVAAVADFRPSQLADQKMKKVPGDNRLTLELVENPDIIASVASLEKKPFTVGFAAETTNLIEYAKKKLAAKNLDLIIANDVSDQSIGFNSDNNATTIISKSEQTSLASMSKTSLSTKIVEIIATKLAADFATNAATTITETGDQNKTAT